VLLNRAILLENKLTPSHGLGSTEKKKGLSKIMEQEQNENAAVQKLIEAELNIVTGGSGDNYGSAVLGASAGAGLGAAAGHFAGKRAGAKVATNDAKPRTSFRGAVRAVQAARAIANLK
jgi:hypothetical protein